MDAPCSFEELHGCLRAIARINRWTFAYRPTLSWLGELIAQHRIAGNTPLRIVDVGCGYGDSLRRIAKWAARRGISVDLTGIDLNPDAIRAARTALPGQAMRFVHGDAYSLDPTGIDVVLSSLLTHHLEEEEIVRFLRWMEATARQGWFINDLHRMAFPYRAFELMGKMLPLHPFARHDGLVSIRRSFRQEDWEGLLFSAGIAKEAASIRGYWPGRLCVARIRP